MCDVCGTSGNEHQWKSEPGTPERIKEVAEHTDQIILEHGHQVYGIFDDEGNRFYYSVGRCMFEKAEFLLTGPLPQNVATFVINEAARLVDEGKIVLDPNGMVEVPADELLAGFPCRIVPCDPRTGEMFQALNLDPQLAAFQIIWPDKQGHFPDEPEFDARFNQPIHSLLEA